MERLGPLKAFFRELVLSLRPNHDAPEYWIVRA